MWNGAVFEKRIGCHGIGTCFRTRKRTKPENQLTIAGFADIPLRNCKHECIVGGGDLCKFCKLSSEDMTG